MRVRKCYEVSSITSVFALHYVSLYGWARGRGAPILVSACDYCCAFAAIIWASIYGEAALVRSETFHIYRLQSRGRRRIEEKMRPKIFLFGDSITEESFGDGGWGACLAHHFCRTVDVVLRGYSGYNTRWALRVLEKVFPAVEETPLAVTVFFGANDASLPDRGSAFQHVPLLEYKQNLHDIVSFIKVFFSLSLFLINGFKRWPTTLVLLITPPPIDEDGRLRFPYGDNPSGLPERTNEAASAYAKECIAVAGECGVPVVDIWTRMQQLPDWPKVCLRDGLHLTQSGNKIVFEEVVERLRKEGLSLETLPADLPLLSEIDPRDPLKAFQI
ncbi:hypothetical protein HHK36_005079 [Tetracentron sinense]|uniref:SGNH hydrolase-type esterase domain-containing protein n=1 Tax=Tetracentron sinense TaxID=13715 RepID=A0A835DM02_TETSI|nr:hypothetical protein HHK36_005079 [Tetracentron sinense]